MNNLNSVLIEGNMVRDPLIRTTTKGKPVCNFSIASNRYYRQDSNLEKEVGFFEIEAWGALVDYCTNQGRKGRGVRVVGRLKQDRWTGEDGKNRNKVLIVAEHVEYRADFKKADENALEANPGFEVDQENINMERSFAGSPKEGVEELAAIAF